MDRYTLDRYKQLDPSLWSRCIQFVRDVEDELGIVLRITSAYRSFEEQDRLYAKGRTAHGSIVTYAKGGQSPHNYLAAFDVVEVMDGGDINWRTEWNAIGKIGERHGFEWGGRWRRPDRPHFQDTELFHRLRDS